MNYYLHRISHEAELAYPLLEHGILSIGFSDFAESGFINRHQTNGWKDVPEEIDSTPRWKKTRSRFGLQRFLQMDVDDHVVVPGWDGTFHVYDVKSDERLIAADLTLRGLKTRDGHGVQEEDGQLYVYRDGQRQRHIDLGFFRYVEEVAKKIPRSGYADNALSARLKVRQTNVEINDIQKNVDEAIARWDKQKPINMAGLVKERCADEVLKLIRDELGPDRLEKLIKWYFERIGASAVIPAKNERGKEGDADIVATFEPIRTIIYVQAKHHVETTDEWAVEQIDSYVKNKEELGGDDGYTRIPWVISTADGFSTECHDKAKRHQIRLVNGKELAIRMLESGIAGLDL